jgi:hypothetical protein
MLRILPECSHDIAWTRSVQVLKRPGAFNRLVSLFRQLSRASDLSRIDVEIAPAGLGSSRAPRHRQILGQRTQVLNFRLTNQQRERL